MQPAIQTLIAANFTCDNPAALTNFNGAAYMGVWYEQTHVKGQFFEPDNATCVQAQYSGLKTDGHFVVYNSMQDVAFGARTGITGTGYCPDATGRCFVSFYGNDEEEENEENKRSNY